MKRALNPYSIPSVCLCVSKLWDNPKGVARELSIIPLNRLEYTERDSVNFNIFKVMTIILCIMLINYYLYFICFVYNCKDFYIIISWHM